MKHRLKALVLFAAWVAAGLVDAREDGTFRDYAPVVNVEPIIETRYQPPAQRVCDATDTSGPETDPPAATIGEDIRRQIRLRRNQRACRSLQQRREHIRGYWVTYRYQGRTYTTRLSYDPGARIPVDISLSPLP
jgi:uncharacterized protein YcfJ